MANEHRGEVEIKLDRTRILKFTTNALIRLEDKLGYKISEFDAEKVGIKDIALMFWASLLHEHKDMTLEEAADIMDYGDFENVSIKVLEALGKRLKKEQTGTS